LKLSKFRSKAFALSAVFTLACTESPQEPADYDAFLVPDPDPLETFGAWSVRLSRADIAFGPVYFCSATSGSATLCKSSIAEVASVAHVDALSEGAARLGDVHGFTGSIRSASFDYGISWFDTQTEATPAAVAPGGHSMHLEGEATRGDISLPFVADVDVTPQYQGQTGVPTAPVEATIDSSAFRLDVHFRAVGWFAQVDFDSVEATGATDLVIAPGSPEHGALLVGVKILAPPEFKWVRVQQ
jgi:hypothetical protein